jgi:hypothetical protein
MSKGRMFFFEKKNQKTFPTFLKSESLFASFSSEKEESSFLGPA